MFPHLSSRLFFLPAGVISLSSPPNFLSSCVPGNDALLQLNSFIFVVISLDGACLLVFLFYFILLTSPHKRGERDSN
jgi:hypothetical protein